MYIINEAKDIFTIKYGNEKIKVDQDFMDEMQRVIDSTPKMDRNFGPDYDNDNTVITDINSLKTVFKKMKGVKLPKI